MIALPHYYDNNYTPTTTFEYQEPCIISISIDGDSYNDYLIKQLIKLDKINTMRLSWHNPISIDKPIAKHNNIHMKPRDKLRSTKVCRVRSKTAVAQ